MLKMMFDPSWFAIAEMAVAVEVAVLLHSLDLSLFWLIRPRCSCVNDSSCTLFGLRLLPTLGIKVATGFKLFGSNLLGENEHGNERVLESNEAKGSTGFAFN